MVTYLISNYRTILIVTLRPRRDVDFRFLILSHPYACLPVPDPLKSLFLEPLPVLMLLQLHLLVLPLSNMILLLLLAILLFLYLTLYR